MSYADLEKNRAYQRAWRAKQKGAVDATTWICKHCRAVRRTSETLRVHEMIAHPEWEAGKE